MSVVNAVMSGYCDRCDGVSKQLIYFLRPDDTPEMVCCECVRSEDQRAVTFSTGWTRQRRPAGRVN